MPTIQQSIVTISFTSADLAASAGGAFMPAQGAPDTADFAAVLMPFAGTVVGVAITGAPASGDTVAVTPQVCTSNAGAGAVAAASLTTTITSAAPAASTVVSKDQADAQFPAGSYLGVKYATTTGGTYGVKDFAVTLYVSTGRTDI